MANAVALARVWVASSGRTRARTFVGLVQGPNMAGEEAQEEGPNMARKWYAYCHLGHLCTKGNRTLGSFWTEDRARESVFNHMHCSPYHQMSQEDAQTEADNAVLTDFLVDPSVDGEPSEEACQQRPKTMARRTDRPEEPNRPPKVARRAIFGSQASGSNASAVQLTNASSTVAIASVRLENNIVAQTRHAVTFVRAMTQAEKALRCAEKVSRGAMETFQDRVPYKGLQNRTTNNTQNEIQGQNQLHHNINGENTPSLLYVILASGIVILAAV